MNMDKEIVPKLKNIVIKAFKVADTFNSPKLKPEHILLSIITDDKNMVMDLFREINLDTESLYEQVSKHLTDSEVSDEIPVKYKGKVHLNDTTKKLFSDAKKQADKLGDENVDVAHILLALLNMRDAVNPILDRFLLSYDDIFIKIRDMKISNSYLHDSGDVSDEGSDDEPEQKKPEKKEPIKSGEKKETPVLDNFCRDLTKLAKDKTLDPVVGRKTEIRRVSQILSRRKKNNPVLIGEPGVGKTAIVEGLAQLINDGKAPKVLSGKRILSLDLTSVVAGTKYRGQFEERMKAMLEELIENQDIVLFIDEFHVIVGAGNSAGAMDAANILKPALGRGEIQVIGATTLDEFRENIEKDGALVRRFQQVVVSETTLKETEVILHNIKGRYEDYHKVKYSDEAIAACVKLADQYLNTSAMPDKAIDALDEAGASVNVSFDIPNKITELEAEKQSTNEEKSKLVRNQQYEKAAELRDREKKVLAELEIAKAEWTASLDKERTLIDVDIVAEVVSTMSGIPASKMSTKENDELLQLESDLNGTAIGQSEAIAKVTKAIKRNRVGIKDGNKPIGSFIFLGPTGVGKTHLAKVLADRVFGDADAMIRIDMSEYMEKHSVSKLVGAPPGYVGYDEGGQLTEKIRKKPYQVILLDEIEKAHDDVFNILLQVLDEGHLTDGSGRKVNFKNTLIIMTSNIGVKESISFGRSVGFSSGSQSATTLRTNDIIAKSLKDKFKPEFLNRLDDTIIFNTLSKDDISKIIELELKKTHARVEERGYHLTISKPVIDYLCEVGYSEEYGARPLARAIQTHIEDNIVDEILNKHIKLGDTIKFTMNKKDETVVLKISKPKK